MPRNLEAPIFQTVDRSKVIWQPRSDTLSVFNPCLVTCSGLLKFVLLLQKDSMKALSHLSGLGFVDTVLIYDIGNGLVYDGLTSAPNMWLH